MRTVELNLCHLQRDDNGRLLSVRVPDINAVLMNGPIDLRHDPACFMAAIWRVSDLTSEDKQKRTVRPLAPTFIYAAVMLAVSGIDITAEASAERFSFLFALGCSPFSITVRSFCGPSPESSGFYCQIHLPSRYEMQFQTT